MTVWLLNGLGAFCCNWSSLGRPDQFPFPDGGHPLRPLGHIPQENRAVQTPASKYAAILTKRNAPDLRHMPFKCPA